ncbi:MAG: type II secretion system F family protein [Bacteroidota bacterium]
MVTIAVILTFISVAGLGYFISVTWFAEAVQVRRRLEGLKPAVSLPTTEPDDWESPLFIRLFGPLVAKLSGLIMKYTPENINNQAERLLESAGHPWNLRVKEYLFIKMTVILGVPLLVYFTTGSNRLIGLINTGAAFLLALIMPDFILKRLAVSRQQKIITDLPDALDLLTVSVEAGLGFDQALLKMTEKTKGPLTEEFKRVLNEMRIGKTRRDALRELSIRTGVEDIQIFTAALIQADQLGVSIGNVLRIQSRQLRERRRLKAEERAQKAPVKMLIPMIIFIFPCLFIILLGPGVLQLIDNFAKMK